MNRLPVLLTRPARSNLEFGEALRARLGTIEIVDSPLIEIVAVEPEAWPGSRDALVFTSRHGVEALAARQPGGGRRAYCVGRRTAEAARDAGFDAVAGEGDVARLPELIAPEAPPALWYVHGVHRRGDLAAALAFVGLTCRSIAVYDQRETALTQQATQRLAAGEEMVAPLFSPRTAALLAAATKNIGANLRVVALSDAVAGEWPGPAVVAARPEAEKLLDAVERALA